MPGCLGVRFLSGRAALVAAWLAAGALAAAGEARALWDDRLELSASHAVYRDDNVLRLPQDAGAAADNYRITSLGVRLEAPVGRQRLHGALALSRVRYDTFDRFDFDGHDASALWQWRPGDERQGALGVSQRRALASLASVQDGVQSTVPNVLTTRRAYASGETLIAARWQLALEASRLEQGNAAAERLPNDLELDRGEARFAYASRAQNRLGLRARQSRGALPNPQQVAGMGVDNSYRQRELGAFLDWRPGPHTRLRAHAGRVRRAYEQLPVRDFEGGIWELTLDWAPTGSLELAAIAQRDISDSEEINVSFVLAERIALQAKYRPGAHTELNAALQTSDRRYLGDAAQVLGAAPARSERVSSAGLAVSYLPHPRVTLSLSLRRERRASEMAGMDYTANVASVGARIGL
jgi:exopolysaccharide biosynthesis operon protein EpsL